MTSSEEDKQQVDWAAVFENLNWDDPARREATMRERLRQRALQYAAPVQNTDISSFEDSLTVLTFGLGNEFFAVNVMSVRHVRKFDNITRVPGVPAFYRGVVNIRGQIVTMLDLRLFFGLPAQDTKLPRETIVVEANGLQLGLLAHDVQDIVVIPRATIQPLRELHYALGVTADRITILDVEQIFEDRRLIVGGS
ncbi:MAG: hypothetical protein D6737_18645 [Chloroflexi bacterium]|nr:MAG: hypothetical protein CUN54_05380 [Phototrophicales bacterium]RMF77144.1 MAG: hypothetical protein D6737_18645 [Chloroflexota bacterium]